MSSRRTGLLLGASAALGLCALALVGDRSRAQAAQAERAQAAPAGAPPAPAGGAGGDGGARPKAASMVIEEALSAPELPPPPPAGQEKKLIGEYIISRKDDVQDCYARRLSERSTLQGKLVVRFDIGPSGRVIGAAADGIGDGQLIACVIAAVRKWEFEKPQSGAKLRIAFPFKLMPQSGSREQ